MKKFAFFFLIFLLPVTAYAQERPGEVPFNIAAESIEDIFAAYYQKENILPFAKCQVFSPDEKLSYDLPFLFMRTFGRRPVAVDYNHIIDVKSSLVFVTDEERALEQAEEITEGKIVLLFDHLPKGEEREVKARMILEKVRLAEKLKAKALVVIPDPDKPYLNQPHYSIDYDGPLPAISITYRDAEELFTRENMDLKRIWEGSKTKKEKRAFIKLRQKMRIFLDAKFAREEGEHFVIFYRPQSLSQQEIIEIIGEREKAYEVISQEIGGDRALKSILFFYPNAEMKTFFTWHVGYSLIWGNQNHEIRNRQIKADDYYETAYHLLTEIGQGISFFKEGAAVYFVSKLRGVYKGKRLEEWMIKFLEEETLIPLPQVISFYIGSEESRAQVSSPEAGAFVDFLIRKFGIEKFKRLYYLVTKGGSSNILKNVEILELICGKEFRELEEEWVNRYKVSQSFKDLYLDKTKEVWAGIKGFRFSEQIAEKLKKDEMNAGLWFEMAYYLNNERDYARAAEALQKYLELKPGDFQGIGLLGLTYYMAGEFEKAEKQLETSVSLGPQSPISHFYLGLVKMCRGKWPQAKRELLKVMDIAPQSPFAKKAQTYLSEIIYY